MQEDNTEICKHIRHVTGVPVEVRVDLDHSFQVDDTNTNISLGGLSLVTDDRLEPEESIQVSFPALDRETSLQGKVLWCRKSSRG